MMEGRRYSDGLHQALEAKEAVPIQAENQTLASITFQNYFRLYKKLAGMTGTAATEAAEFAEIYRLGVVEIPTHRADGPQGRGRRGLPHRAREERGHRRGDPGRAQAKAQPVLVGTVSIEKSEHLSDLLKAKGVPPSGAQRPLPRAGGAHHRAGRPDRRGDHRHQHGGPRHRHPARRQRRHADRAGAAARGARGAEGRGDPGRGRGRAAARAATPAACSSSAPSGTRAAASTTSCAAAPAARAIPAAPSSS